MEVQWLEVGIPLVVMLVLGQIELLMVCLAWESTPLARCAMKD